MYLLYIVNCFFWGGLFTLIFVCIPLLIFFAIALIWRRFRRSNGYRPSFKKFYKIGLWILIVSFLGNSTFMYLDGRYAQNCLLDNRYEVLRVTYYFPTWLDCEAANKVEIRDLETDMKLSCSYASFCNETLRFLKCEGTSTLYFSAKEVDFSSSAFLFDFEAETVTSDVSLEECSDFHEYENVKWE